MYGTGDLARMLPNGEVEFLGRQDFQLKINGVRIEPGEVEARVGEYPGIKKCVVLPKEWPVHEGTSSLIGFYTTEPGRLVSEADLRSFLKHRLVPVMIPARMFSLDAFPVTSIGKVDWRALLAIADDRDDLPFPAAPFTSISENLRELWADLLALPKSQITDKSDFFRLGGQSITAIMLVARVRAKIRRELRVEDIFRISEFGDLAAYLDTQFKAISSDADKKVWESLPASKKYAAHGLQQGLYYQSLNSLPGDDTYILQVVHRYQTAIRPDFMEIAWQQAYARHPALRLRFGFEGKPVQIIEAEPGPLDWSFVEAADAGQGSDSEEVCKEVCERARTDPFDFETGPLFRVILCLTSALVGQI